VSGPALELQGLTKRYGDRLALDDLSFGVGGGQMFGFVGPNGAGKTTAMRMVVGVLAPDAGDVRWHGGPMDAAIRRRIGYMPEERGLYPKMGAREQVAYFGRLHGMDRAAAERAAESWLDRLGLAERADEAVEKLSLGNQQRVQLALALVHEPELLILDEPFSGVDPVGVDVLSGVLLERARAGVPVVFSSHQLDLVDRLCDAVAIVAHGRLLDTGPVGELRRRRAGRRVRVRVTGARDGWSDGVAGARVVDRRDGDVVLELADGGDAQAVLDAARAAGRVEAFGPDVPSLADLFREAVAA
jgi:ABC-2 type transport system ATP-binding protein